MVQFTQDPPFFGENRGVYLSHRRNAAATRPRRREMQIWVTWVGVDTAILAQVHRPRHILAQDLPYMVRKQVLLGFTAHTIPVPEAGDGRKSTGGDALHMETGHKEAVRASRH